MNWARVGIPTMIMAIVVAHGQRARSGVDSGRTRKAANAVVSTTAYKAVSRPVVTLSILPVVSYSVNARQRPPWLLGGLLFSRSLLRETLPTQSGLRFVFDACDGKTNRGRPGP